MKRILIMCGPGWVLSSAGGAVISGGNPVAGFAFVLAGALLVVALLNISKPDQPK